MTLMSAGCPTETRSGRCASTDPVLTLMEASMSTHASQNEKSSALTELDFDQRTRKRAMWEAYEFEILAENQIRISNASYGHEKADHEYTVNVEQKDDGTIIPIHCTCPAYMHSEGDCKHMVACAIRQVVLGAAVAYRANPDTDADDPVVVADGGRVVLEDTTAADDLDDSGCDEDWCPGPRASPADPLPCFDCFRGLDDA